MKKKTVFGIMLTLLLVSMLALTFNIQPVRAEPKTWTVDDDGPADFHTIQEAINAASSGDTIYVRNGTYYEHITITKDNLTILGEARQSTVIDGGGSGTVICLVWAKNINISRFTVQNSGKEWFMGAATPSSGICLFLSSDSTVQQNDVINNGWGIFLRESWRNVLIDNNITSNLYGASSYYLGRDNVFRNNSLYNNTYNFGIFGYSLQEYIQDIDSSNTVNGKPIYYWVNRQNEKIPSDGGFVALVNSTNITVKGIELKNNEQGIILAFSKNLTITNNIIMNNRYGIFLYDSPDNKLYHNNIINNVNQIYGASPNVWHDGYPSGGNYWSNYGGIDFYSGPYQNETGNDGIGDSPFIINVDNKDCYPLMHPWSTLPVHNINTGLGYAEIQDAINANETLEGHTIFVEEGTYYEHVTINKSIALVGEDRSTTIIDGSGNGTVVLVIANNTAITGFTIRESGEKFVYGEPALWCGILVGGYETLVVDTSITGNNIESNYIGVCLWTSMNSTLVDNNIENNTQGIALSAIFWNNISHNKVSDSSLGLNAQYVWKSNISSNTITSSEVAGLRMQDSSFNTIDGNYIENNGYGIDLSESDNNNITGNIITGSEYGMSLGRSSSNLIYHNNFIWNTIQVHNSLSNNTWNDLYPSGGNYWSDYIGVDSNFDGIGDTQYVIDSNNIDNYPLMGQFSDFTATPEYSFQTICNSTISDFQFDGTAIRFNATGEGGTIGFCRICIPRALMDEPYRVFVDGLEIPYTLLPCSNSTHSYLYFTYNHSTHEIIIGFYAPALHITVKTDKQKYYAGNMVQVYGNLTLDGVLVTDGLVGLQIQTSEDHLLVIRTLSTGNPPPTPYVFIEYVTPCDSGGNPKFSFQKGTLAYFKTSVTNLDIQPHNILITVNTFDNDSTPFGYGAIQVTIPAEANPVFMFSIPVPTNAVLGTAAAYANAYTNWPSFAGTPYCMEVNATFQITDDTFGTADRTTQDPLASLQGNEAVNFNTTLRLPENSPLGSYTAYVTSKYLEESVFSSTSFQLAPWEFALTVGSSPTGVAFTANGILQTSPWSGTYAEGTLVSLEMPEIYSIGEARYYWSQWSDGVTSRTRTVTMDTNITLTAHYNGPYYELTVTSSPITGITFTINGVPKTTPYTEWLPEGSYTLEMPKTYNGYMWSHWLEDGDTNRIKTIVLSGTTWTGVFVPTPPPKPVGGYSFQIEGYTTAEPLTPYLALIAILTIGFATIRHKTKRKTK